MLREARHNGIERIALIGLATAAFVSLAFFNFTGPIIGNGDPHYLWLADSFLRGRLDLPAALIAVVGRLDTVLRNGSYFWPLGPLPAVLFMPFVAAFGPDMMIQAYAHCALAAASFYLAFAVARRKGFGRTDAVWLAVAFCLGSVVIGLLFLNGPWYFENLLSPVLLMAALHEREGKDRPLVMGAFIALAAAARLPSILIGGFFFLSELLAARTLAVRARRIAVMAAPVALVLLALGAYDAARFGDPFWTGQRDHYLQEPALAARRERYGVFDPVNVPRNFFIYFLKPPALVDGLPAIEPRGVSVLLLSPIFLWLLAVRPRDRDVLPAAACSALLLVLLLSYFTDGSWQFGPRYLADAAPLAFLLLLGVFRRRGFDATHKTVIGVSAYANLALLWIFMLHNLYKTF